MTTITTAPRASEPRARFDGAAPGLAIAPEHPPVFGALTTLVRRRVALSAHNPREIFVPLLTPILFAVVIAPALAKTVGHPASGIDYMTFVAIATIGLLVPLTCMFSGLGVITDRQHGAQRDLLAAPVPRPLLVVGNLIVALMIASLQLVALFGAAVLRGADFHVTGAGLGWAAAAVAALAITMYGIAETLANKIPTQEEYIGAVPAIAIVPWFFAGSLFPLAALPTALAAFAKVLPLTHALALMRYGLVDTRGHGLHDIWGMHNATAMAALSLLVVVAYAVLFTAVSVRVFKRAAVH
jgi:ABC-type multidrug transport system permease subunit